MPGSTPRQTSAAILATLADASRPMALAELYDALGARTGLSRPVLGLAVRALVDEGAVECIGIGLYRITPEPDRAA